MPAWFVFDSEAETQHEIDPAKLRALVQGLPQNRLATLHFWQEGMADWLPLEQIPELMSLRKATPPPPPKKAGPPPPPAPAAKPAPSKSVVAGAAAAKNKLNSEPVTVTAPREVTQVVPMRSGPQDEAPSPVKKSEPAVKKAATAEKNVVVEAKSERKTPLKIEKAVPAETKQASLAKEKKTSVPDKKPAAKAEAEPQSGALLLFDEPLVGEEEAPAGSERRRSPRENVRFRVMFTWDDVVFRTFSKDLSAHGLKVEHTVPESMVNRQVDCYISSPDMKSGVRFKAVLIEDQPDRLRFRFVDENSAAQRVLQDWFELVRRARKSA